jgi:hypothetical protein
MLTKTRIIIVSILILLGGALFCYCAVFYPIENATQAKGGSTTVTGSGVAPAQETSISGVGQDESDQISQTRSKSKPRPVTGAT